MDFNEANEITQAWGWHLEHQHAKLSAVFLSSIPEFFLPYPTKVIEDALNTLGEYYYNKGDHEVSGIYRNSIGPLLFYCRNEKAVENAAKLFQDPEFRGVVLKSMSKYQNK